MVVYFVNIKLMHFYFSIKSCLLATLNFQSEAQSLFLKGRKARIRAKAKSPVVAFEIQT